MAIKYLSVGNEKLKKSSDDLKTVVAWGIPAGPETCPNAGACKNGCYAKSGRYMFANVRNKLNERLQLAQSDDFIRIIDDEINYLKKKNAGKTLYVRVHDTGDFYNEEYALKWLAIARMNPDVKFYAYTKMITMFMAYESFGRIPDNFRIIFSYGGIEDEYIPADKPHARIFETVDDLNAAGYVDCSANDLLIYTTDKVGLVYHGAKKWQNTGFVDLE